MPVPANSSKDARSQLAVMSDVIKRFDEVFSTPSGRRSSLRAVSAANSLPAASTDKSNVVASSLDRDDHLVHDKDSHPSLLKHVAPHHYVVDNGS